LEFVEVVIGVVEKESVGGVVSDVDETVPGGGRIGVEGDVT